MPPSNGETYKISSSSADLLKYIEGSNAFKWKRVSDKDDNGLEECTNCDEEMLSGIKEEITNLAREKCDFVRPYHPLESKMF
jgi:hypothetical protein